MHKKIYLLTALLLFTACQQHTDENVAQVTEVATDEPQRQTLCLNMIVKDESEVIKRCLASVKSIIDYWVIVDTGSTDGTQKIIKEYLKDIPGELHQSSWKNFGHNRNEALTYAKGKADYILFMDADDVLEFDEEFQTSNLTKDLYNMWRGPKGFTYQKPQIVRSDLPWKWNDATHEYLSCDAYYSYDILNEVRYVTLDDGATRMYDPQKYIKNVRIFKEALKTDPTNHRHTFYMAESYYDAGKKGNALEWYQKRIKLGGWPEEVFWSKLRVGHIMHYLGMPTSIVIESYMQAHQSRPHRVEPIYCLAELYNQQGDYAKAYSCIKARDFVPKPAIKDALFNMDWMEDYGLLFQLSICSFYLGHYEEALQVCDTLLAMEDLPDWIRERTEANRKFPLEKLQAEKMKKKKLFDLF